MSIFIRNYYLFFFISTAAVFSQTDTIIVEMQDSTFRKYSISNIQEIAFSQSLTNVEEEKMVAHIISSFSLLQNYPNPFNPSTTIEYSIPEKGQIEINIYDIQGRLIRSLEQNHKDAGDYKITWNGKNLEGRSVSSGIYFCRVDFNGNILVKKLALIK